MKCKVVCKNLSAKMDGEISQAVNERIEAHLAQCSSCRKEWELLQKQNSLLQKLTWEEPGEEFWNSYTAKWKERQAKSNSSKVEARYKFNARYSGLKTYISLATAASVLVFLSLLLWYKPQARDENAKKSPGTQVEKISPQPNLLASKQEDMEALAEALLHEKTQSVAMENLKKIGPRAGLYLSFRAKNVKKEIPLPWLEALAVLNDDCSFQTLVDLASKNKHKENILPILGRTGRKEIIPMLWENLRNQCSREFAIEGLKRLKPQSTKFILTICYSKDYGKAKEAIEVLGEMEDCSVLPHLFEFIQTDSLAKPAIEALARLRAPETAPLFMELAKRKEYRKEAYHALADFHNPEVFRFLLAGLYKDETRKLAMRALANFGDPQAIPYILDVVSHGNVRTEAMEALCSMPRNTVIPYLIAMLDHQRMKRDAYNALKQITGKDFGINARHWAQWFRQTSAPV